MARHRFQFRLRTLMIVVTLLCFPGAYVASEAKVVRARSAWKDKYKRCHYPCITWGETILHEGPEFPTIRRWLGDRPVTWIFFEYGVPHDDLEEVNSLFPEAKVEINQPGPGAEPIVVSQGWYTD